MGVTLGDAFTATERDNLELESGYIASQNLYYLKFTYTGNKLTLVEVFEDNTETIQLFQKDLVYTGNQLTQFTITRISDGLALVKDFAYSGKQLINVTRS